MKVLVTGATGFFGRAFLSRLIEPMNPNLESVEDGPLKLPATRVAAFARSESRLAQLTRRYGYFDGYRSFLGDVRDYGRLVDACRGMDVVVHAAALKRVDDGSYNPSEMIATNIIGTQNVIKAATVAGVWKVVFISSDKAVEPINVYGATKFCAEQFAISYNAISVPRGTLVSVVRYGNVVGSTGSVLQLWTEQRDAGEQLTVTDPRMSRFWMSVGEASALVLDAIRLMRGGEIFIPLLRSAYMADVAECIAPGHPTMTAGVRAGGEKTSEILVNEDESRRVVCVNAHGRISVPPWDMLVVPPNRPPWTADQPYAACVRGLPFSPPYRSNASSCLMDRELLNQTIAQGLADCVDS